MAPWCHPQSVRDRVIDELCAGVGQTEAAEAAGVSKMAPRRWWTESGRMELQLSSGRNVGLVDPVPPANPAKTATRRRPLTSEDRAVIAAGLRSKLTQAEIAKSIDRDPGVISREIARNSGEDGSYHGGVAHRLAAHHRRRPKPFKLIEDPGLCRRIEEWMDQGWSPKLIAQVLAAEHGADHTGRVSHETIYQALYVQTRGSLRADLHKQLSLKRGRRRPHGTAKRGLAATYAEAFTIRDRPAEAEDRAVPGHWEGDLIMGAAASGSAIGTLVERSTRFTILLHLPGRHDANTVAEAMIREMSQLPEHLRRSITWDRGTELAYYPRIQLELKAPVFFCDPHSPWQRGSNENTNRLLRFWFEKGTDLSVHTADDLRRVAATLNKRPRPTLGLQTPADKMNELLTRAA